MSVSDKERIAALRDALKHISDYGGTVSDASAAGNALADDDEAAAVASSHTHFFTSVAEVRYGNLPTVRACLCGEWRGP